MPGKALSPWTLSWFGSALLFLVLALALAVAIGLGPADLAQPQALAIVHLYALGWLTQMMLGALVQFVPVLAARPLAWPGLALPALLACSTGTLALAIGFLGLYGDERLRFLFLAGPALLAAGFVMVSAMIVATLVSRPNLRQSEVRMVLLAMLGLAGLWASGAAMVLTLAGGPLAVDLTQALPLHLLSGIGGFLSFAAFGVSYKLFAMFLLAPEANGWRRRAVFALALGAAALMLLALALLARDGRITLLLWAIAGLFVAVCGLYLAEVMRLWRQRRRPRPELNMSFSRVALAFLLVAVLLMPLAIGYGGGFASAAVFAALVGWLSTLTLAQLLHITAFLTWLQVFAPQIGRRKVPVLQRLTAPRQAGRGLALWSVSALIGTVSLLAEFAPGFRLGLCGLLGAACMIAAELLAIRRLWRLPPAERPARLPPLILPVLKPQPIAETSI